MKKSVAIALVVTTVAAVASEALCASGTMIRFRDKDEPSPMRLVHKQKGKAEFASAASVVRTVDVRLNNEDYTALELDNGSDTGAVGDPRLPSYTRFIQVPDGAIARLVVDSVTWADVPGTFRVAPKQQSPWDKADAPLPPFAKNNATYAIDDFLPAQPIRIADTMRIRGKSLVFVVYTPVAHNPVRGSLRAARDVTWHLEFDVPATVTATSVPPTDAVGEAAFAPVFNQVTDARTPDAMTATTVTPQLVTTNGADYLIIVHDNFYNAIQPLAQWKHRKGYKTRVVKTSDLGGATNAKIYDYISNAYSNWNPRPTYVLLVGDTGYIPPWYRTYNMYYNANPGAAYDPSDLWYATVDGNDYFPDLCVGRLPCNTTNECATMVNKILSVECNPDLSNPALYNTLLAAAYFQDDGANGHESRVFLETAEAIRDYHLAHGYTVPTAYTASAAVTPRYYCTADRGSLLHTANSLYGGTQTYLSDAAATAAISSNINAGVWLAQHRGHGGQYAGWLTPSYSAANAASLTNAMKLPLVVSINCESAWFDMGGDSVCEAFLKNPNGGSYAAIGDVRVSYSWYNDWFTHGLYLCMYPDYFSTLAGISYYKSNLSYGDNRAGHGTHLGQMLNFGKFVMYEKMGNDSTTALEFDLLNLFGDPEQSPRNVFPRPLAVSALPQLFTGAPASFAITVTSSNTPVAGALVALVLDPGDYHTATSDSNGVARFAFTPQATGAMTVTASHPNFIPTLTNLAVQPTGTTLTLDFPATATEGDAPLAATVTATPAPATNLTVTLASGDTTEATVPATVTILAGQTSAVFSVTVVNDGLLDGTQTATLTASAAGYQSASQLLTIYDGTTTTLSLSVPASASEGDAPLTGAVSIGAPAAGNITIALSSSDSSLATVPATVTIPAGQTNASFTITVVASLGAPGTYPVTFTAHVPNWTDGTAVLNVIDTPVCIWNGLFSGNWNNTESNWLTYAAQSPFVSGAFAQFDDTGLAVPNVTLTTNLASHGVTVNTTGSYTFTGTGVLTTPSLIKAGPGLLTIESASVNSSTTLINGGTLNLNNSGFAAPWTLNPTAFSINNGSTLLLSSSSGNAIRINNGFTFDSNGGGAILTGAGGFNLPLNGTCTVTTSGGAQNTLSGPTPLNLNSQNIVFNLTRGVGASDLLVSLAMNNGGNVIKTGTGILQLTGTNNTYTGQTTVNGGTLYLQGAGKIHAGAGWGNYSVVVTNNATVQFDQWYADGAFGQSGYAAGNLVLDGGTLAYTGIGDTVPASSTDTNASRSFTVGTNGAWLVSATPGTTWQINAGSYAMSMGSAATLHLGGAGNGSFYKSIPAGIVAKEGAGTWTLHGSHTYLGTTVVNAGVLNVSDAVLYSNVATDYEYPGIITVNPGAVLEFSNWENNFGKLGQITYNPESVFINGGTVRALAGSSSCRGVTIGENGATLESAASGQTWTLDHMYYLGTQILYDTLHSYGGDLTLAGVGNGVMNKFIPGTGGLIKTGTGTWQLNMANTYTGPTTILAGRLALGDVYSGPYHGVGSFNSTPVLTVANGATLDNQTGVTLVIGTNRTVQGGGTIRSGTSLSSGACLIPGGTNQTGILSFVGNVTLNAGTTNLFDLGTTSDSIAVNGNLTLAGRVNVTDAGGFGIGAYTLFTYTGSLVNNGLAVGAIPGGYSGVIYTGTPGQVQLIVGPQAVIAPSSYDFGLTTTGRTVTANFSIINIGSTNLVGTATTVAPYSIFSGASYNIASGQTGTVIVAFNSAVAGTFTTNVIFTSNGGNSTNPVAAITSATYPVPNFTATPGGGTAPLLVTFTDTSSGNITSRTWNFGDGGTTGDVSFIQRTYGVGVFPVQLIATGPDGVATNTQIITVTAPSSVTWTNPATGNWSDISSWNPLFMPDNGVGANFAAAGATAIVDNVSRTIGTLTFNNVGNFILTNTGNATLVITNGVIIGGNYTYTLSLPVTVTGTIALNTGMLAFNVTGSQNIGSVISGLGTLAKTGAGILTLTAANTYTGPTTINSGTLTLGGSATLGGGSYTNGITNSANLVCGSSVAQSFSGVISGNGTVTMAGTGSLYLQAASSFGSLNVVGGTTYLQSRGGSYGSCINTTLSTNTALTVSNATLYTTYGYYGVDWVDVASLTLAGGTTIKAYQAVAVDNGDAGFKDKITVMGTNTIYSQGGNYTKNMYFAGGLTGNSSAWLNYQNGVGTRDLVLTTGGVYSNYFGTINVLNDLALQASVDLLNAKVINTTGNIKFWANNLVAQFGQLSGGGTLTANGYTGGEWKIGSLDSTTTYSGVIAGVSKLTKVGIGVMTLTGISSYTGATTISNGTVLVTGSLSNTVVTVAPAGKLGGTGRLNGPVTVYGTLAPGNTVGTLAISNNTAISNTGTLAFDLGASNDLVAVAGDLTLAGTLNITDAGGFGPGSYTLFTYGGALTNNGVTVGTVPNAVSYSCSITNVANTVRLVVALSSFGQWQVQQFGSVMGANSDSDADPDRDGMKNWDEYLAGTLPSNALSRLVITNTAVLSVTGHVLTWPGVSGHVYSVERSTNLMGGFSGILSNIPWMDPVNTVTDDFSGTPVFYRIKASFP